MGLIRNWGTLACPILILSAKVNIEVVTLNKYMVRNSKVENHVEIIEDLE